MKKELLTFIILSAIIITIVSVVVSIKKIESWANKYRDLEKRNADLVTIYQKLEGDYNLSQSLNTTNATALDSMLNVIHQDSAHKAVLGRIIHQMKTENKYLRTLSEGRGSASISGGGIAQTETTFTDEWVTIGAKIDSNKLKQVEYTFDFNVGDIQASFVDGNNRFDIYSVFLQSQRDTSRYLYLGDYTRQAVHLKPEYELWRLWNPTLHLNAEFGGNTVEMGLSMSIASYGVSRESDDVLFYFPDIGFSTNFADQHTVVLGARFNAAHFLPFFQDLHIAPHLGLPTREISIQNLQFRLAIGTTI